MVNKMYSCMQFKALSFKTSYWNSLLKNFWARVYVTLRKIFLKRGKKPFPAKNLGGKMKIFKWL